MSDHEIRLRLIRSYRRDARDAERYASARAEEQHIEAIRNRASACVYWTAAVVQLVEWLTAPPDAKEASNG